MVSGGCLDRTVSTPFGSAAVHRSPQIVEPGSPGLVVLGCDIHDVLGCVVRTHLGWGLVVEDEPEELDVRVALDGRLADGGKEPALVSRYDLLERSFCPVGTCVETMFGSGVLLDFRRHDSCHIVRLWRPRGRGASTLMCQASALRRRLDAAVGFPARTPYGVGVVRAMRHSAGPSLCASTYSVGLSWGVVHVSDSSLRCPTAAAMPAIECVNQQTDEERRRLLLMFAELRQAFSVAGLTEMGREFLQHATVFLKGAGPPGQSESMASIATPRELPANSRSASPLQRVRERISLPERLRGRVTEARTGEVLADGRQRLVVAARGARDVSVPPMQSLEASARAVLADETVRLRAAELLLGGWEIIDHKLATSGPALAAGATTFAASASAVLLKESEARVYQLLDLLESLDLGRLRLDVPLLLCGVLLTDQLEPQIVAALKNDPRDSRLVSAELLERVKASSSSPGSWAPPPQDALGVLHKLGVAVPQQVEQAMRSVSGRESGPSWEETLLRGLDNEAVARKAEGAVAAGEAMFHGLSAAASNKLLTGMIDNLGKEEVRRGFLDGVERFNSKAFLNDLHCATRSRKGCEFFVTEILELCLDSILRVLPSVRIPEVSGTHKTIAYRVLDLDMSGLRFHRKDIRVRMKDVDTIVKLIQSSSTASRPKEMDVVTMEAHHVTAEFSGLHCKFKPPLLPEVAFDTHAQAKGIKLHMDIALCAGGDRQKLSLRISRLHIRMESLDMNLENSSYARMFNPLVWYLREFLKGYICGVLQSKIGGPSGELVRGLNRLLETFGPTLALLGTHPPVAPRSGGRTLGATFPLRL